jgi:hypothetical protein
MKVNPPFKVSKAVLNILQCHYPERLHEAILWHPPHLFQAVWNALQPFLDARTRRKITFLMKNNDNCFSELAQRYADAAAALLSCLRIECYELLVLKLSECRISGESSAVYCLRVGKLPRTMREGHHRHTVHARSSTSIL